MRRTKLFALLVLFLCLVSISMVSAYIFLALLGKIKVSNTTMVCLTGFNLFTYIWYTEFYKKNEIS
jgi:hypothetical protein